MVDQESRTRTKLNRRNFLETVCGTGGIAGAISIGFSGNAVASPAKIQGRVQMATNKPAADNRIDAYDDGIFRHDITNKGGHFEIDSDGLTEPTLGYFETDGHSLHSTSIKNGSPDLFTFAKQTIEDNRLNLGNIKLPDAHLLQVKVEDRNGNPVTDVRVGFYHYHDRSAFGTGRPLVNEDGLFQHRNADTPGIELVGDIRVQVWPENYVYEDGPIDEERFELSEDKAVTFTLE